MKEETKAFWREIVAPTAARIALPAVASQYRSEGVTREEFLNQCGQAYDAANTPATATTDDATQPDASLPSNSPLASDESEPLI